jgi:hypothetical protein
MPTPAGGPPTPAPDESDRKDSRSHSRAYLVLPVPHTGASRKNQNRLGYDQTSEALKAPIAQLCTYRGMAIICQSAAQNGGSARCYRRDNRISRLSGNRRFGPTRGRRA